MHYLTPPPDRLVRHAVITIFTTVVIFSLLMVACDAVRSSARAAEPSKMTVGECLSVLAGLNGLDGKQELTKDGAAITTPYQFGSAKLRLAIQQNIARLTDLQRGVTQVQQDIFREVAGTATEIKPNTAEFVRYQKMILDAQQAPCNIELQRIKADDLKLDKNEIPGSVLGALDKILEK